MCTTFALCTVFQSRTCVIESLNAMPCKWCIYSLNRKKIKCISKKHYLLAHYIGTFRNSRSLIVTHKKPSCASHVTRSNISRQSLRYKQVSASGFPRHPLLSNVYVIEITTPRAPREPETSLEIRFNRPLVFSNDTFLGVFKKLALKSYNIEHIFRIMYIIKSQTSRGTLVTL